MWFATKLQLVHTMSYAECPQMNRTRFHRYNSILIIVNKLIVRLFTAIIAQRMPPPPPPPPGTGLGGRYRGGGVLALIGAL